MKLTEKQKRFIDYYIETGNQTEAARQAGYKKPHVQGAQNYEKLRTEIDKRLSELESKRIADASEVMRYLTSVLREEVDEEVVVVEGSGDGFSEAKVIRKAVGVKDRNKAAELLAKRYGLLKDAFNVTGELGVKIIDDIGGEDG